jgi:ComF family protein
MSKGATLTGLLGGLLAPPVCWSCSGLSRRGEPLCGRCRASLDRLGPEAIVLGGVPVWAPVAYAGPARDLVRALKFRGAARLADAMAAQIVANAPPGLLDDAVAVPVPLHPKRLRSRGYNQAAVIAEAVGRRVGLEVLDCLARSGAPVTQVGRDRAERRAGPAGAIGLKPATPRAATPARVLVIDDVVTTGATLGACRVALVAAGALEVCAVVVARRCGG